MHDRNNIRLKDFPKKIIFVYWRLKIGFNFICKIYYKNIFENYKQHTAVNTKLYTFISKKIHLIQSFLIIFMLEIF
jgi:hypothetical protein